MRPTGHLRERSPGSWELRYSLGTDPATGKRRMATTTVRETVGLLKKSCGVCSAHSTLASILTQPA